MAQAAAQAHQALGIDGSVELGDVFDLAGSLDETPDLVASVRFLYYFHHEQRVRLLHALAAVTGRYVLVQYKTLGTYKGRRNFARRRRFKPHNAKHFCTNDEIRREIQEAGLSCLAIEPIGPFSDRVFVLAERQDPSSGTSPSQIETRDASAQPAPAIVSPERAPTGNDILRQVYHARGLLASLPLVFAAVCFWHEFEDERVIWPLAVALVCVGVALRVWSQAHIRFRLRVGRHLTTTGPYALVRNPLYIANTLICLGATVASELFWLLPITAAWCALLYTLVVRQEEQRLEQQYGQAYRDYMAAVPRWVPRARLGRALGRAAGHVGRSLLTEMPCLLVLVPFVAKELLSPWLGQ
jgi:protein-S-isoprenylcysteine O-methyltransferase Ste14